MRVNTDALEQLSKKLGDGLDVATELDKLERIQEREEGNLRRIMSDADVRLDDPKVQQKVGNARTFLDMLPPRREALEARRKELRKEILRDFEAQRVPLVKAVGRLRDDYVRRFEGALLPFYHPKSKLLKRLVQEHFANTDPARRIGKLLASLQRWTGQDELAAEVKQFITTARRITDEFGTEIESLGEHRDGRKATPAKTRRIKLERMVRDRTSDAERPAFINAAPPAMVNNEFYEPGKVYEVDEATFLTLKGLGDVVEVGVLARAADAVKTAITKE